MTILSGERRLEKEEILSHLQRVFSAERERLASWQERGGHLLASLGETFDSALAQLWKQTRWPDDLADLGIFGLEEAPDSAQSLLAWKGQGWDALQDPMIADTLARFVEVAERLATTPHSIPCFLPAAFFVEPTTARIYGSWHHVGAAKLSPRQRNLESHQSGLRFLLPQGWLKNGLPERFEEELPWTMAYSFALFLLDLLHPQAILLWQQKSLHALPALCQGLPPEIPVLFRDLFERHPSFFQSTSSLRSLLSRFWQSIRSFFRGTKDKKMLSLRWEKDSSQVVGKYKRGPLQDVELTAPNLGEGLFFGGIADGVSTASLGSGEAAAREVARSFETWILEQGPSWAASQASNEVDRLFWQGFADAANAAITARLNSILRASSPPQGPTEDSMSSTFTAVAIRHNRASLAWFGDSPAWHYKAADRRLYRLNVPHSNSYERLRQGQKPNFDQPKPDDEHLSRFLGSAVFEPDTQTYRSQPFEVEICERCLEPGDLLLLASDGLLLPWQGYSSFEQDQKLETLLRDSLDHDDSLREIVDRLILHADQQGQDNISLLALRFASSPSSKPLPPSEALPAQETLPPTPPDSPSREARPLSSAKRKPHPSEKR